MVKECELCGDIVDEEELKLDPRGRDQLVCGECFSDLINERYL